MSKWPYPYDFYANLYRVAKFKLGMDPRAADAIYWWQFKALLGLDRVEQASFDRDQTLAAHQTRQSMAARAERLRNLAADQPDAAAQRIERNKTRSARRARQRADPEWRAEMKKNRATRRTPNPERVVKADGSVDDVSGDIVIVR